MSGRREGHPCPWKSQISLLIIWRPGCELRNSTGVATASAVTSERLNVVRSTVLSESDPPAQDGPITSAQPKQSEAAMSQDIRAFDGDDASAAVRREVDECSAYEDAKAVRRSAPFTRTGQLPQQATRVLAEPLFPAHFWLQAVRTTGVHGRAMTPDHG